MATLKIGDLKVNAEVFDLIKAASQIRSGQSKLPKHVQALVRHLDALRHQKLMTYNCRDNSWTRHTVDAQHRFIVKYDFRVGSVDYAGQSSPAATQQLLDDFVAASGLGSVNAFGQKMGDLFGVHAVTVPLDAFKAWRPQFSFEIYGRVKYHVLRLQMAGQPSYAMALLAIPFEMNFWGERIYDCEWDMPVEIDFFPISIPVRDIKVADNAANETLKPRLEWELKQTRKRRKANRKSLKREQEERAKDTLGLLIDVVIDNLKEDIARNDADIARLKRRLAAFGD